VNWLGKNWSIRFDLSWLFPKPAPPPVELSEPETPAIAQMNDDLEKRIDEP
jgi:hypothetical protein